MPEVTISTLIATSESLQALSVRFVCRRCGCCCNEYRGIKLTGDDMRRMGVPPEDWPTRFKQINGQYVLEQPCLFYSVEQQACIVYQDRPDICRNFPVYTMLCDDGLRHLGVMTKCQAALEALAEMEIEALTNNGGFENTPRLSEPDDDQLSII